MENGRGGTELEERTYVFMIDQLHELELSVGPLRVRHVLKRSGQFLDRHILRGDGIVRRAATETEEKLKIVRSYALETARFHRAKCISSTRVNN